MLITSRVDRETVLRGLQTFDGIDVCGKRLADEIQHIIAANPDLEYISMIGHSMGGLILRYTAGYLFDKDEQRIAGLTPVLTLPACFTLLQQRHIW